MGFINWLMKGIGFEGDEDDVLDDEKALQRRQQKEQKKREKMAKRQEKKAQALAQKITEDQEKKNPQDDFFPASSTPSYAYNKDQFNMQSSSYSNSYSGSGMGGYGSKNVVFYYPKSYSEVQKLIDFLKQGESVMLNLDSVSEDEAQRMLDFASGAVYALNGSVQRVSGNIFLLTPEGLNIMMPNQNLNPSDE